MSDITVYLLIFVGLIILYIIIYTAVKHAIDDSKVLKDIKDRLAKSKDQSGDYH